MLFVNSEVCFSPLSSSYDPVEFTSLHFAERMNAVSPALGAGSVEFFKDSNTFVTVMVGSV